MTENKLNSYVPQLLDSSKAYIKDIRKKMIVNNYLTNFNTRASKDFNKFLTESNTRYKVVKSGNAIEPALNQTMKEISPLSNSILNNKFYTELNTINEENKLKKFAKSGIENKKLIKQIREEQIKDSYSKVELKFREYLNNLVLEKKGLLKIKKTDNDWRKKVMTNYSYDKYQSDTFLLNYIIEEDEKQIHNQLNNYYTEMNLIKENIPNETQDEIKKKKQKIYFNIDTLKMLKYKKPDPIPINLIKKAELEEDTIHLGKFVPYNKSSIKQKDKIKKFKKSQLFSPNKNIEEDNLNEKELYNTRRVVKGEANNLFLMKDKFDKKNEIISNKVDDDFPKIEEYPMIIRKRLEKIKQKRIKESLKNSKYLSTDEERRLNFNLNLKKKFEKWNQDPKELEGYYI
jgi:hypothetical protein